MLNKAYLHVSTANTLTSADCLLHVAALGQVLYIFEGPEAAIVEVT